MQHRIETDGKEPVARRVGQTLATLQHLTDLLVAWGSRKLQAAAGTEALPPPKGAVAWIKRSGRMTARFIGTMGDAYYEWYEKLKARKAKSDR